MNQVPFLYVVIFQFKFCCNDFKWSDIILFRNAKYSLCCVSTVLYIFFCVDTSIVCISPTKPSNVAADIYPPSMLSSRSEYAFGRLSSRRIFPRDSSSWYKSSMISCIFLLSRRRSSSNYSYDPFLRLPPLSLMHYVLHWQISKYSKCLRTRIFYLTGRERRKEPEL